MGTLRPRLGPVRREQGMLAHQPQHLLTRHPGAVHRPQLGVCLDEMGPVSAKSYPGRELVRPQPPTAERAKQGIDYDRRGKGYGFGAFCPATGAAFAALPYPGRAPRTGWRSWRRSRAGSRPRRTASTPSPTT